MEYNLTCKKEIPDFLTVGVKYNVSKHDNISFKVKSNKDTWIMTREDILEYFRIML